MTNIIPLKPKVKPIDSIQLTCYFQYETLEDGSVWYRFKFEDEDEWSEWEKQS